MDIHIHGNPAFSFIHSFIHLYLLENYEFEKRTYVAVNVWFSGSSTTIR